MVSKFTRRSVLVFGIGSIKALTVYLKPEMSETMLDHSQENQPRTENTLVIQPPERHTIKRDIEDSYQGVKIYEGGVLQMQINSRIQLKPV